MLIEREAHDAVVYVKEIRQEGTNHIDRTPVMVKVKNKRGETIRIELTKKKVKSLKRFGKRAFYELGIRGTYYQVVLKNGFAFELFDDHQKGWQMITEKDKQW